MLKKLLRTQTITQDQEGLDAPPGQFVTEKFPVLTFGATPQVDTETWELKVFGLVEEETVLNWDQLTSIDSATVEAPFHCTSGRYRTSTRPSASTSFPPRWGRQTPQRQRGQTPGLT